MSSSNSPTNSPPSTAGETPSTRDNDPSPSATEPALPPPAGIGPELSPGGDEAPATPAQIGADQDRADAATKESMEHIERNEDAPVPPVQTAAAHEEMESTIKKSVQHTRREDVPMTPSQMAAGFENMDRAIKETGKDAGIDPPLPPSQMATLAEEMEDYDEEYESKKIAAPTNEADADTPPPSLSTVLPVDEQEETLQRAQDPPTPAVAQAPSPPPTDQGRSPSNPRGQQQLPIRPPPQSMLPSPDDDADPPLSSLPRYPSMTPVATLVEDRQEALVVPDLPVYDSVQVPEQTWMKEYKKYIFGGLGVLFGAAVAAGVAVSSNSGSSENNATVIERVILSTARPSESSPPSDVPSLRPTHWPSQSSAPSTIPSQSAQPSLRQTHWPSQSLAPSTNPGQSAKPSTKPALLPSSSPSIYWSSLNWSRQGLGFNGDLSHDHFGQAVAFSADASTMAIGAPVDSRNDRPGYVKVYSREGEGSRWEQRGDTIHGEAIRDQFGRSLSLSEDGTTLSVGAPWHDSIGPSSGQVKVYEWDEAALDYVQIGDTLYGAASGDEFGWSLDITSGKILAVGARSSDANGSDSGQVTIFAWDEASSNFKQRGEAIDGDAAGDRFGFSLSLSGNGQKLAVGAPDNDSNGSDSGRVRIFERNKATSNYEQLGDSLLGDAADDWFGRSVSFSRDGTTLAIGAPYSGEDFDFLGQSVSLSPDGTTLAIGAPLDDENGQWSGQVKVFALDEAASNFEQIGQSLYGKAAGDIFGLSVALSSDGKTLAIGADQSGNYPDKPGYVEVYGWDGAASEYKRHGQSLDGEESGHDFGYALALAGDGRDLVVGARYSDRNGANSGRVEVFNIEL